MNERASIDDATPDAALLVAFSNGDGAAAGVLTARLLPRVMGQAVRMLADRAEAEDVAQDAMMRLWRIAPDWRQGEAQVSTWLYRVVANLCTDRLRKRRGHVDLAAIAEPRMQGVGHANDARQNNGKTLWPMHWPRCRIGRRRRCRATFRGADKPRNCRRDGHQCAVS